MCRDQVLILGDEHTNVCTNEHMCPGCKWYISRSSLVCPTGHEQYSYYIGTGQAIRHINFPWSIFSWRPPLLGSLRLEELRFQVWYDLHNKIKSYLYMYLHFCTSIYRLIPNSPPFSMLGLSFFNCFFFYIFGSFLPTIWVQWKMCLKVNYIFLSFFPPCRINDPNRFPSNYSLPSPPIESRAHVNSLHIAWRTTRWLYYPNC